MFDVISLGAATVDIFVKSPQITICNDSLTIGRSSKNEMIDGLITSGGGATNASVSFSRLGLKAACLSLIGDDPLSEYIVHDLQRDNVPSSLLVHEVHSNTDFSVILVADDGGRSIITNRGKSCLEVKDIEWEKISQTQWFYISSLEGNLELLEQIIGFAVEHGIKISLNPGNRELSHLPQLIPLLSRVDFLLLNTAESKLLTGVEIDSANFWSKLLSFGSKIVAVTDGRNGAYVQTAEEKLFSPIINTTPLDETGAGDSFGSAFIAALVNNLHLQEALFWGVKNSASVVSKMGAKAGLLTFTEIKA